MKLRRIADGHQPIGWAHWCPGCGEYHAIWVEQSHPTTKARWEFDGDVESPTFAPSIRIFSGQQTICHYFIRAGKIEFCSDSRHELRGKTAPLPDENEAEAYQAVPLRHVAPTDQREEYTMPLPRPDFVPFPSVRYHPTLGTRIVKSEEEDADLGEGWYHSPADFPEEPYEPVLPGPPAPESEDLPPDLPAPPVIKRKRFSRFSRE